MGHPAQQAGREERAELTARWIDTAIRPDLYPPPVQRTGTGEVPGHRSPGHMSPAPASGSGQTMPAPVQAKMERAFGADFAAVRVHEGPRAEAMGALAYTQGTDIHFAPGQYTPSSQRGQELLGHELAHVVQQAQGRVQAATQAKGAAINDDPSLEREADEMGQKAARGQPVSMQQGGGTASTAALQRKRAGVIQRAVNTSGGEWDITPSYELVATGSARGALLDRLHFSPNGAVNATKIGFIQTLKNQKRGSRYVVNADPILDNRAIPAGEAEEGTYIDRISDRNNPVYGGEDLDSDESIADSVAQGNTQFGHRYRDGGGAWDEQDATMYDRPRLANTTHDSGQKFESSAIALDGAQKDTYYGSVEWGWETDGDGNHRLLPLRVVSQGTPSATFMEAADLWNAQDAVDDVPYAHLPTEDVYTVSTPAGVRLNDGLAGPYRTPSLPAGTRVVVIAMEATDPEGNDKTEIRVVDGPHTGSSGWIERGAVRGER